jgi:hypothetical protein
MVFKLTKEEVLQVCKDCRYYDEQSDTCSSDSESPRALKIVRKCEKWNDHFGNVCLFRG